MPKGVLSTQRQFITNVLNVSYTQSLKLNADDVVGYIWWSEGGAQAGRGYTRSPSWASERNTFIGSFVSCHRLD